jgi:hypothetical protein
MSGWMLAPLGVKEEAFYVPGGYKVLDPETLLLEAEQAVRDRREASHD